MELFVIALIVFCVFFFQSRLFEINSFKKLTYRCYFSTNEACEGDEITLVEEIFNRKFLPLPWLKSEITTSKWLDFADSLSLVTDESRFVPSFFMVKGYSKVVRTWKVKCLKRGVFPIKNVTLISTDLFGQGTFSFQTQTDACVTVLPRPLNLPQDFLNPRHLSGDVLVKRQILSDPFLIAGVREYTQNDPMNRIHWIATARTNHLMVHNNEFTASQSLCVILNMQSREFENFEVIDTEKIEDAIRACCGYFEDTLRSGIPVRFMTNASVQKDRNCVITNEYWGSEHVLDLTRILSQLKLKNTESFPQFLNSTCARINTSDIVIITANLSDGIYDYVRGKTAENIRVKLLFIGQLKAVENLPDDLEIYEYVKGDD